MSSIVGVWTEQIYRRKIETACISWAFELLMKLNLSYDIMSFIAVSVDKVNSSNPQLQLTRPEPRQAPPAHPMHRLPFSPNSTCNSARHRANLLTVDLSRIPA